MKIEIRSLNTLSPYDGNAKLHSPEQIKAIAESIKAFGFNNPLLIASDGTLIAGHGRYEALKMLGREDAPCVVLDHLTDAQRRAYVIADNRLSEIGGGWNEDTLRSELAALAQEGEECLAALGFAEDELRNFIEGADWKADASLVDKVDASLDLGVHKFVVVCPTKDRDRVGELLAEALRGIKEQLSIEVSIDD